MLSTSQNAVLPLEPNTNTITNNSFNAAPGALNSDLLSPVQTRLQAIASSDDFFTRVFGEKANTAEIQAIRSQWAVGDFSIFPKLQIVDAAVMGEAFGAYSQTNQTIYLSDALLANGVDDCMFGATGVLIEETFHWLDSLVGDDTPGDEGELARHLAFGVTPNEADLSRISQEQDQGLLWLNGQATPVELSSDFAGNTFATARNITLSSTPTTFRDWVGSTDTLDYYRFTLNQASVVNFSLTGLSADAHLGLLDANGRWLAWDWRSGTASENITHELNAGTYFIEVRQWSGSTFYNLTASATAVPDLAGNTFASARNITLGSTPTTFSDWVGSIDTLDYYRFTLNQASVVNFSLTGLSADAHLGLLDANGRWLAWDWRSGTASENITHELNAGTYFIEVRQGSGFTNYNLTASATAVPDLAGNTFASARNITLGSTPTTFSDWVGSIDTLDYYRFTLNQASVVNFSLTGLSADAHLGLLDANGRWLAWDWRSGTASENITRELNAGTYFIEVRQGSGFTNYNLTASATAVPDLAGNTFASARNITLGSTPTTFSDWVGSIDTLDYYRFTLNQASVVNFSLTGLSADAHLGLLDANGRWLAWDWRSGTASENITHELNAGTYFIEVRQGSGFTNYNLTASATAVPDLAGNTFASARNITLGSTPTTFSDWVGSIDTLDYYRFTLNQASVVNFSLTGLSADAHLGLLDANGRWLAWDWRSGTASENITHELNAGTYFIEVRQGSGFTNYNLTASATAVPDLAGNTFASARNITLGSTPTTFTDWVGSIDTLDYYRFTLNQTSTVNLSLTGLSADAHLGLLDANGRWLAWDWRSGTASKSITCELNAGTYFIEVRQGSGFTNYNLTATATVADWFSRNLRDEELITITRQLASDGILCRNDMISIFRNVQDGGVIDATEFNDLRTIVNNAARFNMPEYVRVLSNKVVNGDRANALFNVWQPSATDPNTLDFVETISLGNLVPGSTATHMERLIGKWFLGQDRPTAHTGATMQLRLAQGSLFGTDNQISYADIQQGTLGDCYFLAALGSVAHQQPNTIRNMFIDNGDGTFTVRMFGQMNGQVGAVDYVTVDRFLPVNVRPLGGGSYSVPRYAAYDDSILGVWVALAEKAYAQFSQSGRTNLPAVTSISGSDPIPNSYEIIGDGAWGYMALPSITGTSSQYYANTNWTFPGTRAGTFPTLSQISTWLASGRAVAAGTIPNPTLGIVGLHGYVILGVNAVTNTLTLYNPWGTTPPPGQWGHGEINGVRTITYDDFKLNFRRVDLA
jgi:hypothetical protein